MSAALESLMRQTMAPPPPGEGNGLFSFLLIGGGAAVAFVALSSLAFALLPLVDGWLVSTLCYAFLILPVYLLHRRFSFRSSAAHAVALPRYVMVQVMALALTCAFSFVLHGQLALPSLPAALLTVGLTSGVNFVLLKSWAFARDRRGDTVTA